MRGKEDVLSVKVSKYPSLNPDQEGRMHATVNGARHVIPLFEYGSGNTQYGRREYLVLPLRRSGSLLSSFGNSGLPLEEVVRFTNQLAVGIDGINSNNVVHGDIAPHNTLFTTPQRDTLEIVDFGLARPVGEEWTFSRDTSGLIRSTADMLYGATLLDNSLINRSELQRNPERYRRYLRNRLRKIQRRGSGAFVQPIMKGLMTTSEEGSFTALAFAAEMDSHYQQVLADRHAKKRKYYLTSLRIK